ncbi:MAG: hypothetical protein FRX49_07335 [Trebouxia sp. A1-2]|nr:MAG: hypothetical protein FRX49_07335 [Trebouxia sp. A1-2]
MITCAKVGALPSATGENVCLGPSKLKKLIGRGSSSAWFAKLQSRQWKLRLKLELNLQMMQTVVTMYSLSFIIIADVLGVLHVKLNSPPHCIIMERT